MPKIKCNYGLHFSEIAKKFEETVDLKGNRLSDLIDFLEEKYRGFKDEVIDAETGDLLTRNGILIEREGENTKGLHSPRAELRSGDVLTFF
ncbi:MAG TPA: hypothetical protein VLZ03_13315 [Thermodesulfobacteriota bacterium]|nr:hypothetical protein [Thermodesulfobacteriota bacterium]